MITYISLTTDNILDRLDIGTLKAVQMGKDTTEMPYKSFSLILNNSTRHIAPEVHVFWLREYAQLDKIRETKSISKPFL